MALKKGNEIATIDVAMVTLKTLGASVKEIALDTSNKVEVTPSTETTDAVKNIVKGKLIAQKPAITTLTGNAITLTDNVFNAELVQILQGGEIKYWADSAHSAMGDTDLGYGVARYTPPLVGSDDKGEVFELCLYSAIYNAAGVITGYEKCTYPNCQGQPVAFGSEDNVFRVPSYTINSAPDTGEAPYVLDYVDALPSLILYTVTQTLSHVTSNFAPVSVNAGTALSATLTAEDGYTLDTVTVTMGGTDITATAYNESTGVVSIASVTGNVVITATATT